MSLFDGLFGCADAAEAEQRAASEDIPWTLDRAIGTFLNRWHWRGERAVVELELRQLIEKARDEDMAEVCRNAGCQEIR